jgi:hypothetical protein
MAARSTSTDQSALSQATNRALGAAAGNAGGSRKGFRLRLEAGIIIGALIAALVIGIAINLFLGGTIRNPHLWFIAILAGDCIAIFVAAMGFFLDRVQTTKSLEYRAKLDAVKEEGDSRYRKFLTK